MSSRQFEIGIITDEISRNVREALEIGLGWGLRCFELREGETGRLPAFTRDEIEEVEAAMRMGARVTAVSPGVFKGPVEARSRREHELEQVLPHALELAQRFACAKLIIFGFERHPDEPEGNRLHVLRTFEQAAERAEAAGVTLVVENEPNFWVDRPEETVALLEELGHPALRVNWDPANLVWGGGTLRYESFERLKPFIRNLHVKDVQPQDEAMPWRPLGEGVLPWDEVLEWIVKDSDLPGGTVEPHCVPLQESAARSVDRLRAFLASLDVEAA